MLQLQADLKPRPWPPIECSSLPSRSAKFRVGRAATRRHRASTRKARQSTRSARWATSGATPAMVFAGSPSAWQPGAYCCRWRGPRRSRRPARQPFSRRERTGKISPSAGNRNPTDAARRRGTGPRYLLGDPPRDLGFDRKRRTICPGADRKQGRMRRMLGTKARCARTREPQGTIRDFGILLWYPSRAAARCTRHRRFAHSAFRWELP